MKNHHFSHVHDSFLLGIEPEMESSRPWPWPRGASRTTGHVLGLGLGLGGQVLGLGLGLGKPVAVLGKNIWGAWPLIIWEATTAKRNYYRTN